MDRALLADFLRARREVLQPEDVGLPRGPRRRTGGLRREEVAALAGMSVDYYSRIEQQRGPVPSEQVLAGIARALHLSLSERDHLFDLAGHSAPRRVLGDGHVSPTMLRIVERLSDTPALVMSRFNETLLQNPCGDRPPGRLHPLQRTLPLPRLPLVHRPGATRALPRRGPRSAGPGLHLGDPGGVHGGP